MKEYNSIFYILATLLIVILAIPLALFYLIYIFGKILSENLIEVYRDILK